MFTSYSPGPGNVVLVIFYSPFASFYFATGGFFQEMTPVTALPTIFFEFSIS